MTVRLDKYKGIEIFVGNDGQFFTEDQVLTAETLPVLKKLINGHLKEKRKGGLQPTAVILMDNQLDEDPDEEVILGVSGTNGQLRLKSGGTYSSWGGTLVFLPEEFPADLIEELKNKREAVKKAEDEIRQVARYNSYRGGRLEADRVIELEKEISEALTGEKGGADGDV
jgi:hypothetical protein